MRDGWTQNGYGIWRKFTRYFVLVVWETTNVWYRCNVSINIDDKTFEVKFDSGRYETVEQAQIAAEDLLRLELEAELARLG